jgi:hypothetical protein
VFPKHHTHRDITEPSLTLAMNRPATQEPKDGAETNIGSQITAKAIRMV